MEDSNFRFWPIPPKTCHKNDLKPLISELYSFHRSPLDDQQFLCQQGTELLQSYLSHQQDWVHNFGLDPSQTGLIIGKMFGILVVHNKFDELGFLAAFSGKLAEKNHHPRFVPPVYDMLQPHDFFIQDGIIINQMNDQIRTLEEQASSMESKELIQHLKTERKQRSSRLQQKLFNHYQFLNAHGSRKSLIQVFSDANVGKPPAGAGECAAPKLLQYAYLNHYQPLVMTEFWWGSSPKSEQRKHQQFYPACREKCGPILKHMIGSGDLM
jgi:tRNA pseudouridine32 synthase/23S rRNA pseudouridine746 synthase